eukprot:2563420-Pyramimonas_sp.AAC.1
MRADKATMQDLHQRLNLDDVEAIVVWKQGNFSGHVLRRDQHRPEKKLLRAVVIPECARAAARKKTKKKRLLQRTCLPRA